MNPRIANKIAHGVIYTLVAIVIIILIFLISYILVNGLPYVTPHFLSAPSQVMNAGGGIRDQLFNSIYLLILTLIISFPIALGAGIYLSEYGSGKISGLIRTTIEVLSSLPSIIVGLFVYLLFVIRFHIGFSILSGAVALTFFNLPILTRNIEDSFQSVPNLQREAGISLGLSHWKTITGVIFPEAIPGIITGIILSSGRVFGEAAALIYTSGQSAPVVNYADWNPFDAASFLNPMRPAETLAVHIWKLNTEGLVPDAKQISSGSSAILILVILIFNISAHFLGNYLYRHITSSSK
ncbi:phosphate transport system permease protein PstA [Philodulcilactobacillus myokoensis]|uniref:Phosphate transport system permease protein PstA n=1 Tax=Philodulcilactobacillus myokoensis TaxID=2929573 RepID=A0A9W6EUS7_9LACO|nr:phosphate ABC transporter permease PstA [Philodulcilactobacillus myokoensis]GLB47559.1 phosphate transport system permease protein PstA [Philodulcilactobacillus myokoensis]